MLIELKFTTRRAEVDDITAVIDMLGHMHTEIAVASLSAAKVLTVVHERVHQGQVFILEGNGVPVGTIGLEICEYWYSLDPVMQDIWIFVEPDYRCTNAFTMLIGRAVAEAKQFGIPLMLCLQVTKDVDRKKRLFGRYLDPVMEAYMLRPVGGIYEPKEA